MGYKCILDFSLSSTTFPFSAVCSAYNQRQKVSFLWHSRDVTLLIAAALCGLCCIVDKDFLCVAASNISELEAVPSTMMSLHVGYRQLAVLRFFFFEVLTVRITVRAFGGFLNPRFCLSLLSNIFQEFQCGRSWAGYLICSLSPLTMFFSTFFSTLFCVACSLQVSPDSLVLLLEFPAESLPLPYQLTLTCWNIFNIQSFFPLQTSLFPSML